MISGEVSFICFFFSLSADAGLWSDSSMKSTSGRDIKSQCECQPQSVVNAGNSLARQSLDPLRQ